jgi:TPP-dependent pyruvate/acetoin dehydrogenase alpha subunit
MQNNHPNERNIISENPSPTLYRSMLRIRRFEETVLSEFSKGRFIGTTHTYLGQEANAVGVISSLEPDDIVVSNHRSHGHFLAYGGDMHGLFAELMGKSTGICGGRGGSQHLHWRNFYSNGVLGGTTPIAVGIAFAEKSKNNNCVTVIFIGDGTLGEGVLYESLNLASLWSTPILFVLENNQIAQTTPIELNLSGDILTRFSAFGIESNQLDTSDVVIIKGAANNAIEKVRITSRPQALILNTHRFGPHSKGDDTRPSGEIENIRQSRDPLTILAQRIDQNDLSTINKEVNLEVDHALEKAITDPLSEAPSAT